MKKSVVALVMMGVGLVLIVAACTGAAGEQGIPGPQGPQGEQGIPGLQGPPGAAIAAPPSAGILAKITDAAISAEGIATVTFTLAANDGSPLSLDEIESVRFLIARIAIDAETGYTSYVNYFTREVAGSPYTFQDEEQPPALTLVSQPTFESGDGQFQEFAPGTYTYTFAEPLGENYDSNATHVIGAEIIRGPRNVAANPIFVFLPAGGDPQITRFISNTETCNGCHGQLSAHGGSRTEYQLCVLCHTPQNVDPESGNSLDLKVMLHKIHSGAELPTVQAGTPYYLVGFQQTVLDFSAVGWSQDTRSCTTCHTGEDGDNFKTAPTRASCTSCHDDVDPTTSVNHPGRPKNDTQCMDCHLPEDTPFDLGSVTGAHTIPRLSDSGRIKGVNFEIISVENVAAGQAPTATFKITMNNGDPIAPDEMDYLALTLAGPTRDYAERVTEIVASSAEGAPAPQVVDNEDGSYRYTFQYVLPNTASGTYAFAVEGYRMEDIPKVDDPVRIVGNNPLVYVALDEGEPEPRREVIDPASCNTCHGSLAFHGDIRQNTEYCVACHNANATDEGNRPVEAMPPVTINFRVLIHQLHRGEEAAQPIEFYGFGGRLVDFNNVVFPRNLANCENCHLPDTYNLGSLSDLLPTTVTQGGEILSITPPMASTCISCHDATAVIGHAELQTTESNIETCEVCHGAGREFDAALAHEQ